MRQVGRRLASDAAFHHLLALSRSILPEEGRLAPRLSRSDPITRFPLGTAARRSGSRILGHTGKRGWPQTGRSSDRSRSGEVRDPPHDSCSSAWSSWVVATNLQSRGRNVSRAEEMFQVRVIRATGHEREFDDQGTVRTGLRTAHAAQLRGWVREHGGISTTKSFLPCTFWEGSESDHVGQTRGERSLIFRIHFRWRITRGLLACSLAFHPQSPFRAQQPGPGKAGRKEE